jgi:NAD(P)-dependent dehydrogenase (short-subunit alcohol dehydrogenase family)
MTQWRFDGKVALVTGAGRGAGRTHALLLASRGAKVVVADPGVAIDGSGHSNGPADEVVKEIKAAGGEAVACYDSVAEEKGANAMVEAALDSFGRLDAVLNNAGIADPKLFGDCTPEDFRRMTDVHYNGTVFVSLAAWRHFAKNGGGRIVNTVSEGAMGIQPKCTTYGGAKGAVIGLTLGLACDGPRYGIYANAVAPRVASRMSTPEVLAEVYDKPLETFKPLGHAYRPELCSVAAAYLAHGSCPLNGVMLISGGGQVMRVDFMRNEGFASDALTIEALADNIDTIMDMDRTKIVSEGLGRVL